MGKCRADVSTHSRLKAAGAGKVVFYFAHQCFNTQPPEGGWIDGIPDLKIPHEVSTHSRLKAAGAQQSLQATYLTVSTHSRLKAAGL